MLEPSGELELSTGLRPARLRGTEVLASAPDAGYRVGELHAWIGDLATNELIDLSSRYWPRLVESVHNLGPEQRLRWRREDPPAFVWGLPKSWPAGVRYQVVPAATEAVVRRVLDMDSDGIRQIVRNAKFLLRGTKLVTLTGEWSLPDYWQAEAVGLPV